MVEEIRIYCEEYNEWPKQKEKVKKANIKTSHQLAQWLNNSGYNNGKFKYVELKNKLDELKSKYYKSKKKFDQSKKELDEERHDKIVNKVISNKEKSNERKIHEIN